MTSTVSSRLQAVQMTVDEFGGKIGDTPIEIISADFQNKADVSMTIARRWIDQEKVDIIVDAPNSSIALAVAALARDTDRIYLSGAVSSDITGKGCAPNSVQFAPDSYSFAAVAVRPLVERGMKSWFALTVDYALGHSMPEFLELARCFPDTRIVVDQCGGPIRVASYARAMEESFATWRADLKALARCENVWIKLGGLGMRIAGSGFEREETLPTSQRLADAWRPYIETCIEGFGPACSMFESNFPPDKSTCSYAVLWNAFRRIAENCSEPEKVDLFARSASRFYGIAPVA
jgi:hypothetical protein